MTHDAAGEARLLRSLRTAIAARLHEGVSLDSVERELIAPSPLSEEQQAALWLYGWSFPKRGSRRAALDHPTARRETTVERGRSSLAPRAERGVVLELLSLPAAVLLGRLR